jgi:hypothetical protein
VISWSPLTGSNRRPSPYHEPPACFFAAGHAADQPEHKRRRAPASARQPLASTVCHSICHSVRSCEPPPVGDERWDALLAAAYDATRVTRDADATFAPHGIVIEEARHVFDHLGLRVMAASPAHIFAM